MPIAEKEALMKFKAEVSDSRGFARERLESMSSWRAMLRSDVIRSSEQRQSLVSDVIPASRVTVVVAPIPL